MDDDTRKPPMNPAQSEIPGMPGNSMRENRETPLASGRSTPDRLEKATSYTASAHASGESDEQVVPAKRPNKGEQSPAEGAEGSCSTKGSTGHRVGSACPRDLEVCGRQPAGTRSRSSPHCCTT